MCGGITSVTQVLVLIYIVVKETRSFLFFPGRGNRPTHSVPGLSIKHRAKPPISEPTDVGAVGAGTANTVGCSETALVFL